MQLAVDCAMQLDISLQHAHGCDCGMVKLMYTMCSASWLASPPLPPPFEWASLHTLPSVHPMVLHGMSDGMTNFTTGAALC